MLRRVDACLWQRARQYMRRCAGASTFRHDVVADLQPVRRRGEASGWHWKMFCWRFYFVCLYFYVCCLMCLLPMGGAAPPKRILYWFGLTRLRGRAEARVRASPKGVCAFRSMRNSQTPFGAREIRAGISPEPGISASVGVLGAPLAV